MHNVFFYSAMSPQQTGSTRYGIPVTAVNQVFTGFVTLDTYAPFMLTKISACFSASVLQGFRSAHLFEFRLWDQSSGRQMFQSNVSGIDDGFLPFSMFSSRHIGQTLEDQTAQPANMSMSYFELPEECEFPSGAVIRIDVKPRLTPLAGTVYVTLTGFSHD
jgi:hypothetical protein